MRVIGLDIGGANLKAADNDGNAVTRPFALWRESTRLRAELSSLLGSFEQPERVAVTMTAELCDCFDTKAEGVDFILGAVETVADGTQISVWQTGGEFVSPEVARDIPLLVAAANWHALATFCGRMVPEGAALLLDVGSTTTDVIPLLDGIPVAVGMTDFERLKSGELVYTGVRRTPVAAVANRIELAGEDVGLSSELFATMRDVYQILGELAEAPDDCDTANGRPATIPFARDRLARMLCCDRDELGDELIDEFAQKLANFQRRQLVAAIEQVIERQAQPVQCVILSGEGVLLAENAMTGVEALRDTERLSLPEALGAKLSSAACAFAVAKLAGEAF